MIEEKRMTRESECKVQIEEGARRAFRIDTGIAFLNHMIETVAWRVCINIDASFDTKTYNLQHVVAEDIGITLGRAFGRLFEEKMKSGINGTGSSIEILDEACALVAISVEGRCTVSIDLKEERFLLSVEDMKGCDLEAFFQGFSQGMKASIQIKVLSGRDPHHVWESIFRAFGTALKGCFIDNAWRRGVISGVKGVLE